MKSFKKIAIFIVTAILLCSLFSLTAFAAADATENKTGNKLDMNLGGDEDPLDFGERLEYALQGTVTGMLMIFGVLSLLAIILYGSKFVFYDIPNKKKLKAQNSEKAMMPEAVSTPVPETAATPAAPVSEQDEGELVAVITAAVAAMLESSEYKNEFVGGFRVVSFKRSEKNAWNRK